MVRHHRGAPGAGVAYRPTSDHHNVVRIRRTTGISLVLVPITYIHPCLLLFRGTDKQLNRMAGVSRSSKTFTAKQGQYLAFIHLVTAQVGQPIFPGRT
jgi:hypothetical protein